MKKYWLFGIICFLFLAGSASAESIVSSDIDLDRSTVTVSFTEEVGTDNGTRFECFGEPPYIDSQEVEKSFTELGIDGTDLPDPVLSSDDCFHQAGDYSVLIHIWDNAGNDEFMGPYEFQVLAGNVDPTISIIASLDCSKKLADNAEECSLDIQLRDEYGNPVTQLIEVTSQLITEDFSDDANTGTQFISGLRYADDGLSPSNPKTITGSGTGNFDFILRAFSPSVSQVAGGLLAQVVDRVLDFDITVNTIEEDGSLGVDTETISLTEPVSFLNLFALEPTGKGFIWRGENEAEGTVTLDLTTTGVSVPANRTGGVAENNDNLVYTGLEDSIPFNDPTITTTLDVTVVAEEGEAYDIDQVFSFYTDIAYDLGGTPVAYPAGGTGLDDLLGGVPIDDIIGYMESISPTIVGADIEGGVIGDLDKLETQPKSGIGTFNISEATDKLRDQITENVFRLSRGSSNTYEGSQTFSADWFTTYNVVIVEVENGNVTFPTDAVIPSGKNTLIIRNGNMIIDGNMSYENPEDSFGIILINDEQGEGGSENGNIFIRSDVRTMVGTYYADGGLMTNDTTPPDVDSSINAEVHDDLYTQLLLTGTLFSQNTLGGSMILPPEGYFLPWGRTDEMTDARKYDLHYVRRYQPTLLDGDGNPTIDNTANCAPLMGDIDLLPIEDVSECDTNENAFVIRIDRKASVAPPPGFESTGAIVR